MTYSPLPAPEPDHPSVSRSRWRIPLIWLVPVVAALIGLSMLIHAWQSTGPEITVTFRSAAGLEPGKTPVKYKDVTVGTVSAIALSDDGSRVAATLSLVKSSFSLTRKDTRFWVVRPRVGAGGISGVDSLLSGPYIALDIGTDTASSSSFTGLETPPMVTGGMAGKSFILRTDDLGSLDVGSPVYYRRIQVGRVASYQLGADGKSVDVQVFIDAPHDRFVTQDTRFWNASGVDVSLGADGLKLKTQSLATIVSGGIAFATPPYSQAAAAAANAAFTLAPDQATAMAAPDGPAQYIQLRFEQPLRGLSIGAPVQFSGVDLGRVVSIELDYDAARLRFPTVVGIIVHPQRLGRVLDRLPPLEGDTEQQSARFLKGMVDHGLRAQARTGNLLTGQLYIALDFMPNAPKVAFDTTARPVTLPTIGGSFDKLQEQLASIVAKLDKLPLESIGKNLDATLADLDKTLKQVHAQVLPQTTQTLKQAQQTLQQADQSFGRLQGMLAEDAPLQQNLQQTLQEAQRAARSLRTLTDLLGRHPESLLRGRPSQPAPEPVKPSSPRLTPDQHPSAKPASTQDTLQ
jgi:paraquat-inducible protein B